MKQRVPCLPWRQEREAELASVVGSKLNSYDSLWESVNKLMMVQELNVIAIVGHSNFCYVIPLFFGKKKNVYTLKTHFCAQTNF